MCSATRRRIGGVGTRRRREPAETRAASQPVAPPARCRGSRMSRRGSHSSAPRPARDAADATAAIRPRDSACSVEQPTHGGAQRLLRAPAARRRRPPDATLPRARPIANAVRDRICPGQTSSSGCFRISRELAVGRRRNFHGDLVGLELEQRLVLADRIAGGLAPAQVPWPSVPSSFAGAMTSI